MISITARLLISASLVLTSFLGFTGYALEEAYSDSATAAVKDRLQGYVMTLIAAAEIDDQGRITVPKLVAGAPFTQAGSGVYARILSNDGRHDWRSPDDVEAENPIPAIAGLASASGRFVFHEDAKGEPLHIFSLGINWGQDEAGKDIYTFSVAENLDAFNQQMTRFRQYLLGWLAGVALLLLVVQALILRWGLAPLRRAADDLAEIEAGRHAELEGAYPRELRGLTGNLNALIRSNRENLERYRHSLADLAHSLNTPLALLRGAIDVEQDGAALRATVRSQADRMSQIVAYQLQRAATSGRVALAAPVSIAAVAHKIRATLDKVYADKRVDCRIAVADQAVFHGDEGDLYELLGNLMDNAYKWGRGRVCVSARPGSGKGGEVLELQVEDDGEGIPACGNADITARGVRADSRVQGHGIGLAVVRDIVNVYHGSLEVGTARLGGARITIAIPSN